MTLRTTGSICCCTSRIEISRVHSRSPCNVAARAVPHTLSRGAAAVRHGEAFGPAGVAAVAVVTVDLDALAVGQWAAMSGYRRDRFEHWTSQGNGCDTRDVVLRRDGTGVAVNDDCRITAGTWFSAASGTKRVTPSSASPGSKR